MDLSILIPSHGRPDKLRTCLQGLTAQTTPASEVIIGLDGGSRSDAASLEAEFSGALQGLRVIPRPKAGLMPTRRHMLDQARGDIFLSLNDDVRPAPELVDAHLSMHHTHGPCLVTGPAPWRRIDNPDQFDLIATESDLIFFHPTPDSSGKVGFRDCVGLNFSCPVTAARDAGGFPDLANAYGYEDIELAFRVGLPVMFAARASVEHDHRYRPRDVAKREYLLGHAAWSFRKINPAFAEAVFHRDIASADELRFCEQFLRHGRADALRIERRFIGWGDSPPLVQDAESLAALAEHWIPLKRYLWRWGLLDASKGISPRYTPLELSDPRSPDSRATPTR